MSTITQQLKGSIERLDEETEQAAAARVAGILGKTQEHMIPDSVALPKHWTDETTAAKPTRRIVKGLCRNCGKNYSRHKNDRCSWNGTTTWLPPPAGEPERRKQPEALAGVLTMAQADRILWLDGVRTERREAAEDLDAQSKSAWGRFNTAEVEYFNYIDSLTGKRAEAE